MKRMASIVLLWAVIACSPYRQLPSPVEDQGWKVKALPAFPQTTTGDPEAGFQYLGNGDYLGSGIPLDVFMKRVADGPDTVLGRYGANGAIPYEYTAFEARNGAKVVNGNCFSCHAGYLEGRVIPGLGDSFSDYRKSLKLPGKLMNMLVRSKYKKESAEYRAFDDFGKFFNAMAPNIVTNQPGVNPAFRLAEACMQHRNPSDLTYSKERQFESIGYAISTDVPPLWHVKKKHALYYTGIGRGDFTKLLLQASVLGVPDSAAARHAAEQFDDVLAWLKTLEPPAYPKKINSELAQRGRLVFEENCSSCHGTYGQEETYPNKVVALNLIKTDPVYANYAHSSGIVDWYNKSWFALSEPRSWFEPQAGYVAPPLDGIWATAPYLHNGSVPTLQALLHSRERPEYWSRDPAHPTYDFEQVGWAFEQEENGSGKWTYDTNLPGYGNRGHYFGDKLSKPQRAAVIEYLKTL